MLRPLHDVPEPEVFHPTEVFTFYGLAAYSGQVLEKGLVNLVAVQHTDGVSITRSQFDTLFDRFDSSTFGQLVREARARIQIPPGTEALLAEALKKRNRLVHDFFADNATAFMTDSGCVKMIAELRDLVDLFQRADREAEKLWLPIAACRGLTEERVDQIAAKMERDFLATVDVKASASADRLRRPLSGDVRPL